MFHYSIAPSPLSNIYATEINNLEMGVPKYLAKYKVHIDASSLTSKIPITCKCLWVFLVGFLFIRAPVMKTKLQVLEKFCACNYKQ